jgi:hypothetical protein
MKWEGRRGCPWLLPSLSCSFLVADTGIDNEKSDWLSGNLQSLGVSRCLFAQPWHFHEIARQFFLTRREMLPEMPAPLHLMCFTTRMLRLLKKQLLAEYQKPLLWLLFCGAQGWLRRHYRRRFPFHSSSLAGLGSTNHKTEATRTEN